MIAQTCLAYLAHLDKPDSITDANKGSFPLATYAAEYWFHHHRYAEYPRPSVARKLLLNLFSTPPSYALVNWVRLHDPDHPGHYPNLNKSIDLIAHPLYYASLLGESTAVDHLLNTRMDPGMYGAALQAASSNGHIEIVRLFLNRLNISTFRGGFVTALYCAWDQPEIAKLLMGAGALDGVLADKCDRYSMLRRKASHLPFQSHADLSLIPIDQDLTREIKPDEHNFAYGCKSATCICVSARCD